MTQLNPQINDFVTELTAPPVPDSRSKLLPPLAPLGEIINMRLRLNRSQILFPQDGFPVSDLQQLADDPSMKILSDYQFTHYSMEPTVLAFLKDIFSIYKPVSVVEMGSGISTAILSRHLQTLHGSNIELRYVTIDQSEDFAK